MSSELEPIAAQLQLAVKKESARFVFRVHGCARLPTAISTLIASKLVAS